MLQEELEKALDQVVWVDFVCNNQHTMAKKDYGKVSAMGHPWGAFVGHTSGACVRGIHEGKAGLGLGRRCQESHMQPVTAVT